MQRLKIKEVEGAKVGEMILAYAIPVLICSRMMGRDGTKITDHIQTHTKLERPKYHTRQNIILHDQMVNANPKRVLAMTYSLAAQVRHALPETLIEDLENGLTSIISRDYGMVAMGLARAGVFIQKEKHAVAELNAWKQFFSVEVAKQGEWDNHNLSEYNIGRYL